MRSFLIQLILLPLVVCIVPRIDIKAYTPKGIKACMDEQKGVVRMDFHANINKKIMPPENGNILGAVIRPSQGIWCFVDRITIIKIHDIMNYWVEVFFDGHSAVSDVRSKVFRCKYICLNYKI